MKSRITLCLSFFFILSVKAQQYHPLMDSSAVWHQVDGGCDNPNGTLSCTGYGSRYFFGHDTLINNHKLKILFTQSTYYYEAIGNSVWSSSNTVQPPNMTGAMREDSSKKVWILFFQEGFPGCNVNFPSDSEVQLYDFNIELGDTLFSTCEHDRVIGIDSFQLQDGSWRKRYELKGFLSHVYWIEGIGSTGGLLEPFVEYFENFTNLTCYESGNELLYEVISSDPLYISCDFINSVDDIDPSIYSLEIYPNPSKDFVSINFSAPNFPSAEIKITDMPGRNLFTGQIKRGETMKISTGKFPGSIVFCQLWQNGQVIATKKILIQK